MSIKEKLTALGDAIRSKTGTTELMSLDRMIDTVGSIPSSSPEEQAFLMAITEGNSSELVIPSGITKLRDRFCHQSQFTSITIPSTVNTIGQYAFLSCSATTSLIWHDNIVTIDRYAFQNCSKLQLTKLPENLTTLGMDAFYGCYEISITSIPKNVTDINEYTFYLCKKIPSMRFHSGIKTIGDSAFASCAILSTVIFDGTPISIHSKAFNKCTKLLSIKVPWSEGEVSDAPWGATNATITYNYTGGDE